MHENNLARTEVSPYSTVSPQASMAYSDQFLIEDLPSKEPYIGAGDIDNIDQSLLAVSMLSRVWPKKEDPLIQADLLSREEEEVQGLIHSIRTTLLVHYRQKLANRLTALFNDSKEEEPYGAGISADSLHSFIKLLQLHPNLKLPYLSLTPELNIYASWRDNQNRIFSIHFLSYDDVRFLIFKPNYRHPERKIRISGTSTTDILMETVLPHNISDWVLE